MIWYDLLIILNMNQSSNYPKYGMPLYKNFEPV